MGRSPRNLVWGPALPTAARSSRTALCPHRATLDMPDPARAPGHGLAARARPHHVRGDLVRSVPVQVKLEGHHLVVVRLQLALHHLVPRVAHLWEADGQITEDAAPACPGSQPLTFRMVSRGRLALSCRERARVDLRWCFRAALPSSLPPPKAPSQLSLSSFPEVTSEPP